MPLEPGSRLGPYEVLAPIGNSDAGGERYKASDTRANRIVALKVLPIEFTAPELKQRLERDARTISSLQHPQICAVVDVGHQDPSTEFVVSEFVEGETLAQRLVRGPLDVSEALTIAMGMADALDKAHRHGVVHGALNPSVVMLTPQGPKLLDFGLATLQGEASGVGPSAVAMTRSVTSLSAVPFTAAPYLAPEQLAGSDPDPRSDIFAFGAIVYEMITGHPAFAEKTLALLIAAIQSVDPEPMSKVQPLAPPALDFLVKRCLTKDPKQRLQTALDLTSELQWIADGSSRLNVPAPVTARTKLRERLAWTAVAVAAVLLVGLVPVVAAAFRSTPRADVVRFPAPTLPTSVVTPILLSPDGRWLAASPGGLGSSGVVGLSLDSVTAQPLAANYNITQPFWSPDSRSLAFFDDNKLKRVDVGGGPAQVITDSQPPVSSGTWNQDGVILFPSGGLINRVLAAGGQATPITKLDASKQETEHVAPVFLPDGHHFLFLAVSSKPAGSAIYVASIDSAERTRLFASDSKAVYAAPGYVLFNRADTVFAQAFDAKALTLTGEPIRVASGVASLQAGLNTSASHTRWAAFAVSQTGVFAYRKGSGSTASAGGDDRTLLWIDRNGSRGASLGTTGTYAGLDLSPDGKRFAVHRHEGTGGDVWFFDLAQGRMQRLTFDATQDNQSPVWSPDGTRIAFGSQRNNQWGVYVKRVDGAAAEDLLVESDVQKIPLSWSPDGKLLLYVQNTGAGDIWAVPTQGDRKPIPILQSQFSEGSAEISPDGKWLAYQSNETGGRPEIYVKPFPDGAGKWQVSTDGGQFPRWRRDGKEIFYYALNYLLAVDIRVAGTSIDPGVPRMLFGLGAPSALVPNHGPYHRFAVDASGSRFLVSQNGVAAGLVGSGGLADAILASVDQGGTTATAAPNSVSVVLNWPELLKQK